MRPKVWISTMYSGETDFSKCKQAIDDQTGIDIEHHVISHKSELEAHQEQIKFWLNARDRFDLFVKVDADTVIIKNDAIIYVYEQMLKLNASAAQLLLDDAITNTMINGLNFYTPETNFSIPDNKLYCDRSVKHRKIIYSDSFDKEYVPVGLHCHFASPLQAFHYGLHRGLKNQHHLIQLIKNAMLCSVNPIIQAFALKGFEASSRFKENFNYTDLEFQKAFNEALDE